MITSPLMLLSWLFVLSLALCTCENSLRTHAELHLPQVTNLVELFVGNGPHTYYITYATEKCIVHQSYSRPFRIRTWGSYIMEMVYDSSDCMSAPAQINMYSLSSDNEVTFLSNYDTTDRVPIDSMLAQATAVRLIQRSTIHGVVSDLLGSGAVGSSHDSLGGAPASKDLPLDGLSHSKATPPFPLLPAQRMSLSAEHSNGQRLTEFHRLSTVSCPFSVVNSGSATQNYDTCDIYACPEDVISVSMCPDEAACVGNTYFRLYLETEMVMENDDSCDVCSSIEYLVTAGSECSVYTLRMGCFGMSACSGDPVITVQPAPSPVPSPVPSNTPSLTHAPSSTTNSPTMTLTQSAQPTTPSPSALDCTFSASNTASSTENFSECPIYACPGERIVVSLCEPGSSCDGDTFYRLYLGSTEVAVNDDVCGMCSEITYTVPPVDDCAVYTLRQGCFADDACAGSPVIAVADTRGSTYVYVNDLGDGPAGASSCAPGAALQNCTLRSAIQLCVDMTSCRVSIPPNSVLILQSAITVSDAYTLTIMGHGSTIIGSGDHRFMRIKDSTYIELYGMSLRGFGDVRYNGGAIYLSDSSVVSFFNVLFEDNVALSGGGAYVTNSQLVGFWNCSFLGNFAIEYGGGLSGYEDNYGFFVTASLFLDNSADGGGGLSLRYYNNYFLLTQSSFHGNAAEDGGGVHIDLDNYGIAIRETVMTGNGASNDGGGLFSSDSNDAMLVSNCVIEGNTASSFGGGMYIGEYSYDLVISNCAFSSNSAGERGGAISFHQICYYAQISNTIFWNNAAPEGGGISSWNYNNVMEIVQCAFIGNTATDGGALSVPLRVEDLHISSTLFDSNVASRSGGTLYMALATAMEVLNCEFESNAAASGGGVYVADGTDLYFESNEWQSNIAWGSGGALTLNSKSFNVAIYGDTFVDNNAALVGGALYVNIGASDIHCEDLAFLNNTASKGGGGVYIARGNRNLRFIDTDFIGNIAGRGSALVLDGSNHGITLDDVSFQSNSATSFGGTLYLGSENADVHIANCEFVENVASTYGGM